MKYLIAKESSYNEGQLFFLTNRKERAMKWSCDACDAVRYNSKDQAEKEMKRHCVGCIRVITEDQAAAYERERQDRLMHEDAMSNFGFQDE